jgi:opacity protein-like surface antigen
MNFKSKNLVMLFLIGTAFISSKAKSQSKNPIHIGFKAGMNSSDLSLSKGSLDSKYSLGYHFGAFSRVDLSSLYLQGEVLYSQKRSKIEGGSTSSQQAKWNNIDVPVLLGYKLLKSEKVTLRVFGGGVYSYVLKEKASILKQVSESFQEFDKSNIGYQAGAGVDFGRLSFDLKYEGALTNISQEFKSRPSTYHASIGFMIF